MCSFIETPYTCTSVHIRTCTYMYMYVERGKRFLFASCQLITSVCVCMHVLSCASVCIYVLVTYMYVLIMFINIDVYIVSCDSNNVHCVHVLYVTSSLGYCLVTTYVHLSYNNAYVS